MRILGDSLATNGRFLRGLPDRGGCSRHVGSGNGGLRLGEGDPPGVAAQEQGAAVDLSLIHISEAFGEQQAGEHRQYQRDQGDAERRPAPGGDDHAGDGDAGLLQQAHGGDRGRPG